MEQEHGLEGLRRGVRHRPRLLRGAEAPAPADGLAPVPPVAVGQRAHLLADQPLPGLGAHLRELLLEPGLRGRLHRESRVPGHAAVVALHLQAVLGHPQVGRHARHVRKEGFVLAGGGRVGLAAGRHPGAEQVQRLAHGPDGQVVRLDVLGVHVLLHEAQARAAGELPGPQALVDVEEVLQQPHGPLDRAVVVDVRDAVHELAPLDLVVLAVRRVELLPERGCHRISRRVKGEAPSVEVAHRQVDHAAVAPEPARVQREPLG
mmetsp:Transcript_95373/g.297311  ORF Transcript_95373/g.297311 Transcript_95373/m.297311 type:complete len:262 (+) Transcript_95373:866-1651(+)